MNKTSKSDSGIASPSDKGLKISLGHLRECDGDVREPSHNPTREQAIRPRAPAISAADCRPVQNNRIVRGSQ
jgi:hypothetical protein